MNSLKIIKLISLTILFFSLAACGSAKVDQLDKDLRALRNELNDLRSVQAESTSNINQMRAEFRTLTGQMEELQHLSVGKTKQLEQSLSALQARVPPPAGVPEDLLSEDENRIAAYGDASAEPFKRGLSLVRTGDFAGAREAFNSFIEANPGTAFTDNALFWLALSYDQLGQSDRAVSSYSEVFQKFPAEDRVPAALYFMAQSFQKLGAKDDAVITLQKLVDEHGRSAYAAKARAELANRSAVKKKSR